MNGCHSTLATERLKNDIVYHSKGNVSWKNTFTRDCQYIKQGIDDKGCYGCKENNNAVSRTLS